MYNGYCASFFGVKGPGRGVDYPPPSSAEVKKERAIPLLLRCASRGVLRGDLYLLAVRFCRTSWKAELVARQARKIQSNNDAYAHVHALSGFYILGTSA